MHQIYEVAMLGGWEDNGRGMQTSPKSSEYELLANVAKNIGE
jgi:hypothetical protein